VSFGAPARTLFATPVDGDDRMRAGEVALSLVTGKEEGQAQRDRLMRPQVLEHPANGIARDGAFGDLLAATGDDPDLGGLVHLSRHYATSSPAQSPSTSSATASAISRVTAQPSSVSSEPLPGRAPR